MRQSEICECLNRLELESDATSLRWENFLVWPLVRQALWLLFISNRESSEPPSDWKPIRQEKRLPLSRPAFSLCKLLRRKPLKQSSLVGANHDATSVFFSNWLYLVPLPSQLFFDRVADPVIFLSKHFEKIDKIYISRHSPAPQLFFPAASLFPSQDQEPLGLDEELRTALRSLAARAGVNPALLECEVERALGLFMAWYSLGKEILDAYPKLNKFYIPAWHFWHNMGLVAAMNDSGRVLTIELQHGQQGRFQAMYSWWSRIPQGGYAMMPKKFWCWGEASCRHILATDPERNTHIPFVGGFPWPEYYRKFIKVQERDNSVMDKKTVVLVTLQTVLPELPKIIPDFIIKHLVSAASDDQLFIFRYHPNNVEGCRAYCARVLAPIPQHKYILSDGTSILYNDMSKATHHITAFSSSCYEANDFGVPTLLFGNDAKEIYSDEINSGMFEWTSGEDFDINIWIRFASLKEHERTRYFVSSLEHVKNTLHMLSRYEHA